MKADSGFPVLYGFGGPRFAIERTKAYLQRQESGRGRAYKSRRFLLPGPQLPVISNGAGSEPVSWAVQCADSLRKRLTTPWDRVVP